MNSFSFCNIDNVIKSMMTSSCKIISLCLPTHVHDGFISQDVIIECNYRTTNCITKISYILERIPVCSRTLQGGLLIVLKKNHTFMLLDIITWEDVCNVRKCNRSLTFNTIYQYYMSAAILDAMFLNKIIKVYTGRNIRVGL